MVWLRVVWQLQWLVQSIFIFILHIFLCPPFAVFLSTSRWLLTSRSFF